MRVRDETISGLHGERRVLTISGLHGAPKARADQSLGLRPRESFANIRQGLKARFIMSKPGLQPSHWHRSKTWAVGPGWNWTGLWPATRIRLILKANWNNLPRLTLLSLITYNSTAPFPGQGLSSRMPDSGGGSPASPRTGPTKPAPGGHGLPALRAKIQIRRQGPVFYNPEIERLQRKKA